VQALFTFRTVADGDNTIVHMLLFTSSHECHYSTTIYSEYEWEGSFTFVKLVWGYKMHVLH